MQSLAEATGSPTSAGEQAAEGARGMSAGADVASLLPFTLRVLGLRSSAAFSYQHASVLTMVAVGRSTAAAGTAAAGAGLPARAWSPVAQLERATTSLLRVAETKAAGADGRWTALRATLEAMQ
jgi:hypothetical protein